MAMARSLALRKADMNSGTRRGTSALARFTMFPVSKSAPLAIWAFMILSVSSSRIGMNRRAMDMIMATSCTGTRNSFRGFIIFSMPSVRLLGVVVRVMMEEPIISMVSLTAMLTAIRSPSTVMVSFQKETSSVPGVRNRLKNTVISSKNRIARIPFTIYRKGTWERPMTTPKNTTATPYPRKLRNRNREMMKSSVPPSFTLGSSLCTTDSV